MSDSMNSVLTWPLWSLRDSVGEKMDKLKKGDINCLISMLLLGVRFVREEHDMPDVRKDGEQIHEFSIPTIDEIAKTISVSRDSIERSFTRLRALGILRERRENQRTVDRTVVLPSPPHEPPVPRINASPIRWVWLANITDTAKRLMTFLWTYRRSHLLKDCSEPQLVNPSSDTLARSCRSDKRTFYEIGKGREKRPGAMNELEILGWVTLAKKRRDRSSERYVRIEEVVAVKPQRKKTTRDYINDLMNQFDRLRDRAGYPPIFSETKKRPDRRAQAEQLIDMVLESGATVEQYLQWAEVGIGGQGTPPVVSWRDLVSEVNFDRFLKARVLGEKTENVIDLETRRRPDST